MFPASVCFLTSICFTLISRSRVNFIYITFFLSFILYAFFSSSPRVSWTRLLLFRIIPNDSLYCHCKGTHKKSDLHRLKATSLLMHNGIRANNSLKGLLDRGSHSDNFTRSVLFTSWTTLFLWWVIFYTYYFKFTTLVFIDWCHCHIGYLGTVVYHSATSSPVGRG